MDDRSDLTSLLTALKCGDTGAFDRLFPLVYAELHRIASGQLRREGAGHSLQPTLLVHELYLRLAGQGLDVHDRTHFLGVAARVMRRILVDAARTRRAMKRGGGEVRVTLTSDIASPLVDPVDALSLDLALSRLEDLDARQARVVELSYFGGLTYPEIGALLDVSEATVDRDLRHARAWLRRELTTR